MCAPRLRLAVFAALFLLASPAVAGHGPKGHFHHHAGGLLRFVLGALPHWVHGRPHYVHFVAPPYDYHRYGCPPYGGEWYDFSYPSPYGSYYRPDSGSIEYYLPPIYYPAELSYGPQAVMRFFGLGRLAGPPDRAADVGGGGAAKEPGSVRRASNPATLARARRLITLGDRLYQKQRYHEALQQYKSAVRIAPDLAEAYFRQGHAFVATNRYELAAAAFRRGLSIDPGYMDSGFRLDAIYGDARLAKASHLDTLAATALAHPDDADLLFLLGIFLHFDGSPARAQKFFRRAADLEMPSRLDL